MRAVLGSRRWGHAAAAWAGLFAALHLFWAAGGALGLAESAGRELAAERPLWFVAAGLYGVALALVTAAGLGVLLARSPLTGAGRLVAAPCSAPAWPSSCWCVRPASRHSC